MENEMMSFRALGDATRLEIVRFLSTACCGRVTVDDEGAVEGPTAGEVCCHLTGAKQINSTISHHLHELEAAGIVNLQRVGRSTQCSLNVARMKQLGELLIGLAVPQTNVECCPKPEAEVPCCG